MVLETAFVCINTYIIMKYGPLLYCLLYCGYKIIIMHDSNVE